MNYLFKEENIGLEKRFPSSKYVYTLVPYILKDMNGAYVPMILDNNELKEAELTDVEIKNVYVVFKKMNWSIDNDIRRCSRKFNTMTYKKEFDFNLYCENVIKRMLILIIDQKTGEERYMDEKACNELHSSFCEGLIDYFFKIQPYQENLSLEEKAELSSALHQYFSYWRKKNSGDISINGQEAPPCPSIVIEKALAENNNWTLEYIRSLDYRDIEIMQLYETQKNIDSYEGSDAAKQFSVKLGADSIKVGNEKESENSIRQKIENAQKQGVVENNDGDITESSLKDNPSTTTKNVFEKTKKKPNIKK